MNKNKFKIIILIMLSICFLSCATTQERLLDSNTSQLKIRSIQTRIFDITDKKKMLRAIISTLQDLGFVIDKADYELGTVSATKLNKYALRITVTIRPRNTQMIVRANAQYEDTLVDNPKPYQDFFNSLSKSLFLEAHQI